MASWHEQEFLVELLEQFLARRACFLHFRLLFAYFVVTVAQLLHNFRIVFGLFLCGLLLTQFSHNFRLRVVVHVCLHSFRTVSARFCTAFAYFSHSFRTVIAQFFA